MSAEGEDDHLPKVDPELHLDKLNSEDDHLHPYGPKEQLAEDPRLEARCLVEEHLYPQEGTCRPMSMRPGEVVEDPVALWIDRDLDPGRGRSRGQGRGQDL
jgi:hypothetical protein